jgi:hypothetical protein
VSAQATDNGMMQVRDGPMVFIMNPEIVRAPFEIEGMAHQPVCIGPVSIGTLVPERQCCACLWVTIDGDPSPRSPFRQALAIIERMTSPSARVAPRCMNWNAGVNACCAISRDTDGDTRLR